MCIYFILEATAEEMHLLNVTSRSFTLYWDTDHLNATHEVSVTHLRDQTLVMKRNVSGQYLTLHDLEPSQTYHVTVKGHNLKGHVTRFYKGIITTSKLTLLLLTCYSTLMEICRCTSVGVMCLLIYVFICIEKKC